jgi:hypothetical protein
MTAATEQRRRDSSEPQNGLVRKEIGAYRLPAIE